MDLEIDIEGWPDGDWEALAKRVLSACGDEVSALKDSRLSASLLFTTDDEVHALNKQWRGKDKPTNVLSFPMLTQQELRDLEREGPPVMLGDLALAYQTCDREAEEKGISLEDHAAHLLVHGFLHLCGYDHVHSDAEANAMETVEIATLAKMGIADPYGDCDLKE